MRYYGALLLNMIVINQILRQKLENKMKNSKVLKGILLFSGILIAAIGAAYLFTPIQFYSSANETDISGNVNLLSEVRASGGALFAGGILIILGVFVSKLTYTSTVLSILIWLGYGVSRILSVVVDGVPNEGLMTAMILEIIFGVVFVFALLKYQEKEQFAEVAES